MKSHGLFIVSLCLATAWFGLRHRHLQGLESRAAHLRHTPVKTAPAPLPADRSTVAFTPQDLLHSIQTQMSGSGNESAVEAIKARLETLSDDELRTLCAAARAQPEPAPGFLVTVASWAATALRGRNDALAAGFFADMPQTDNDVAIRTSALLFEWIRKDSRAAAKWLQEALASGKLNDSPQLRSIQDLLEAAMVKNAPVDSIPRIQALREEDQPKFLAVALSDLQSQEQARTMAKAILNWPVDSVRNETIQHAMDTLIEHGGFDTSADWIDSLPDVPADRKDAARISFLRHGDSIHATAERATWAVAHASPDRQADVAAQVTTTWTWQDYNAAGAWLRENRAESWFDAAAAAFAAGVARTEPTTAFDWAMTISDESLRRNSLADVMRQWEKEDRQAARAYLEASAVPASWKTEFTGLNAGAPAGAGAGAGRPD